MCLGVTHLVTIFGIPEETDFYPEVVRRRIGISSTTGRSVTHSMDSPWGLQNNSLTNRPKGYNGKPTPSGAVGMGHQGIGN